MFYLSWKSQLWWFNAIPPLASPLRMLGQSQLCSAPGLVLLLAVALCVCRSMLWGLKNGGIWLE